MGCLEIIILAALGFFLIGLFFFAVEIAICTVVGIALFGGVGFLIFGAAGLKVGAVIGLVVGLFWAFGG